MDGFVDGIVPAAWLSTCIVLVVRRGTLTHVDKHWLIPRPEAPERIDALRSVPAVERYLEGDRDKCGSYSRATYESLLALSDGAPGIRYVTATTRGGVNAVLGWPSASAPTALDPSSATTDSPAYESPSAQPRRKRYRLKDLDLDSPGVMSDALAETPSLEDPRGRYRAKALDVVGFAESHAIIMRTSGNGHLYAVLPDDRRLRGMPDIRAYFNDGDHSVGMVVEGLYALLLPHADFSRGQVAVSCSSSDGSHARPHGTGPKTKPAIEGEDEEATGSNVFKRRRKRRSGGGGLEARLLLPAEVGIPSLYPSPSHSHTDSDDAADSLEDEECLPQTYSRSARKHGRGAAVAPFEGGCTGAADTGGSGEEGSVPAAVGSGAVDSDMAHGDDEEENNEEGDEEDTAEAYGSEAESGMGARVVEDGASSGEDGDDTANPLSPPRSLPTAKSVGASPVAAATSFSGTSAKSAPAPGSKAPLAATSAAASADPAALVARLRASAQQAERLAQQAERINLLLGPAKQQQAAAAAAEVEARQAIAASQAASVAAAAAEAAARVCERTGQAKKDWTARAAAEAAAVAEAAAKEAAAFSEKAHVAERDAETARAADVAAAAAVAAARREKEEAAARVASLEAELRELAARCPA